MTTDATNDDGLTFNAWLRLADKAVSAHCGLSLNDLSDGPSWDAWNDAVPPSEYAEEALANDGFPF